MTDKQLQKVKSDTLLVVVCFESQMCDKVIMEKHDVPMDIILTDS